jgi:membrane fusion protein, multidrug efflux system
MNRNYILIIAAVLMIMSGCGKSQEAESKSMEQLHTENGVPVKLQKMQTEEFSKKLQYNGKLSGINQSTKQSLVAGEVEGILFQEGDYVKAGEIVVTFPEDLAGMNYQAAMANYNVMSASYERLQNLYTEGGISQQEVDNVEAGYLAAASQMAAVEQMLKVPAPISGYITAIYVNETDYLESGDLLFTVSELKKLKSKILVTEKEIGLFSKGIGATAIWEDVQYQGKVSGIGFAMNERRGAFEVDLEFANPQEIMKFNINALIEVEVYHSLATFVLEKKHLSQDRNGDYVYVRQGDRVEKRYVELGNSEGIRFEVISGLAAGEEIVVEGKELLEDNSLINIKG